MLIFLYFISPVTYIISSVFDFFQKIICYLGPKWSRDIQLPDLHLCNFPFQTSNNNEEHNVIYI